MWEPGEPATARIEIAITESYIAGDIYETYRDLNSISRSWTACLVVCPAQGWDRILRPSASHTSSVPQDFAPSSHLIRSIAY